MGPCTNHHAGVYSYVNASALHTAGVDIFILPSGRVRNNGHNDATATDVHSPAEHYHHLHNIDISAS